MNIWDNDTASCVYLYVSCCGVSRCTRAICVFVYVDKSVGIQHYIDRYFV